MGLFLVYIIKSAFCLVLFYLFYRLLLSRETFHRFNRFALLSILLLSCLIPLCEITLGQPAVMENPLLTMEDLLLMAEPVTVVETAGEEATHFPWHEEILLLYVIGIIFFFIRNIWSLVCMLRLMMKGYFYKEDGVTIIVHRRKIAPFSWMKFIVISEDDLKENGTEILTHEKAHVKNLHSWDLLVAEICILFQWFNPAAWLLKQELQTIHEYEADESVIQQGIDAKKYQLLLIKKAVGARLYSIANSFNHSSLKKRISMMLKEKSSVWAKLKFLYVLPLAAVTVAAFARPEVSNELEEISAVKVSDLTEMVKTGEVKNEQRAVVEEATPAVAPETGTENRIAAVKEQTTTVVAGTEKTLAEIEVKGVILDAETGKTMPGASIVIKSTSIGTLSDKEGVFSISVEEGSVLCVSYVGRRSQELIVSKNMKGKELAIALERKNVNVGEVVVVGYGEPKVEDKAKAMEISKVKAQEGTVAACKDPKTSDNGEIFEVVEDMPSFPGGIEECMRFLSRNIKYPVEAQKAGAQGRVIVNFIVNKDGTISDVKAMRSVSKELDAEAVRVVQSMPKWKPGKQRGQAVDVRFTMPVTFRLRGKDKAQESKQTIVLPASKRDKGIVIPAEGTPLFMVNGVRVDNINDLNPDEIQSITVLKDKSATELYGEEAKNGVVVVTLKGKE